MENCQQCLLAALAFPSQKIPQPGACNAELMGFGLALVRSGIKNMK